ncbi:MAG TPA: PilZ domain-containing protein [Spirochaetota bacterium]|nr:PilZ domain-containing protein [Spirochaetota bacterium]HPS86132.1 PilZ domain-containing protein [Spirochaetota bacterium]
MKDEKRKHKRFKINQMCEIYMGREIYIPVRGLNMSEGGLSFKTEESLAISSIVNFQLAIHIGDKSRTIECEGVVRRVNSSREDYLCAIEFTNLTNENKKIIREYVNSK